MKRPIYTPASPSPLPLLNFWLCPHTFELPSRPGINTKRVIKENKAVALLFIALKIALLHGGILVYLVPVLQGVFQCCALLLNKHTYNSRV